MVPRGLQDKAVTFDGVDDKVVNNGISDVTNNFTVSFWAQPTAIHEIDAESTSGPENAPLLRGQNDSHDQVVACNQTSRAIANLTAIAVL